MSRHRRTGLPHALLFTGPGGLGKHALTLKTAQWLLCSHRDEQSAGACGECHSCHLWTAGNHPDFMLCQPEDGSRQIRVDGVRRVNEFLNQTPQISSCQVVILHPAEVLNLNAANALLKTLEEPPGESFILLESERSGSVLPTIRSRCQTLALHLPELSVATTWMVEQGMSESDADQALRQNHFAPLAALMWLQNNGLRRYGEWVSNLSAWSEERQGLETTVKAWKNDELIDWLTWFSVVLTDMTKARSGVQPEQLMDSGITERFPCATLPLSNLLALHARVVQTLSELHAGASYYNRQLLLESLLIDWQTMTTPHRS